MPGMLNSPDGCRDKRRTTSAMSADAGVASRATGIRMALNGTGAVQIFRASTEHPIVLDLPPAVVEIVARDIDWATQIENPADDLAQKYREWEDGTSSWVKTWGKGNATCYDDCCGDPGLLFWTLDHFSDAS